MSSEINIEHKMRSAVEQLANQNSLNLVCHEHRIGEPLPSIEKLNKFVGIVREILFPGYFGNTSLRSNTIKHYVGVYVDELFELLSEQILAGLCFTCANPEQVDMQERSKFAQGLASEFISFLPEIRRLLVTDVEAAYLGDPAANSQSEVIYCYPTIRAIINHRVAHQLLKLGVPLIPRIISEMGHSETGIDIHPGAQIGEAFTIDHGTGVVIGSNLYYWQQCEIVSRRNTGCKKLSAR